MTSVSHLYADFGGAALGSIPPGLVGLHPEDVEDLKLSSFEGGYKAGWDDAIEARSKEQNQLSADVVQQLQDMSFTYHEAYSKLSKAMQPLMTRFVTKVLPEVAHQSLGVHLMDQIGQLMDQQSENAIQLAVAPETRKTVEGLMHKRLAIPFSVTEDSTLSRSQIYLRVAETERAINLDEVIEGVSAAVEAFFHTLEQEVENG